MTPLSSTEGVRCPVCGTPGRIVSSDDGTQYFEPTSDTDLRAALLRIFDLAEDRPDIRAEARSALEGTQARLAGGHRT